MESSVLAASLLIGGVVSSLVLGLMTAGPSRAFSKARKSRPPRRYRHASRGRRLLAQTTQ
jgi:hypothetical protein